MRTRCSSILAVLSVCAFGGVTPAAVAGNFGDANAMRAQAQIHPNEPNQNPDYTSGFATPGEVYPPGITLNGHFVRSRFGRATALAP